MGGQTISSGCPGTLSTNPSSEAVAITAHNQPTPASIDPTDQHAGHGSAVWLLLMLLFIGFLLRLLAWWFMPNFHHADEVFQYREQAYRLLSGVGVIPWEYQEGIRSWLIPGLMTVPMHVSAWLTGDTVAADWFIAAVLALLSLVPVYAGWVYGKAMFGLSGAVVATLWMLGWHELIYFSTRSLTSPVAAHLMIAGGLLCGLHLGRVGRNRLLLGGIALALAAVVRPHLLPAVVVITAIAVVQQGWRSVKWIGIGSIGVVIISGLLDMLTFDYPYQWAMLNFKRNVVDDVASKFGTDPWYGYWIMLAKSWLYLSLPLLVLFIVGCRRLGSWAVVGLVVVASFSLIGHKEYRFIYPGIVMAMLVCGIGLAELSRALLARLPQTITVRYGCAALLVLALAGVGLERGNSGPYDKYWRSMRGPILALERAHKEPGLESLLIYQFPWYRVPGYSTLRRDVPMFFDNSTPIGDLQGQYTHILSGVELDTEEHGLEELGDWHAEFTIGSRLYLYRSTRAFGGPAAKLINDQLRR